MTKRARYLRALCRLLFASLACAHASRANAQDAPPGVVLYTPPPPPGAVLPPSIAQPPSAPTPTPPSAPAGVAGWFPGEGFIIATPERDFSLRVGFQGGYLIEPYWRDGQSQDRRTFFVLRPILAGNAFKPWIRFWTSLELAQDTPFLLDSYVEIQPIDEFGLRIGQQFTPLSRHEYLGPQQILFPDWAPIANYFWTGRDKGVTAYGSVLDHKLDYWAGIYSGSPPRQAVAFNDSWVTNLRLTVNPMGPVASNEAPYITSSEPVPTRVSFTLQAATTDKEVAQLATNPSPFGSQIEGSEERSEQQLGAADLWLQGPRHTFLAEAYVRRTNPQEGEMFRSFGFWAQAGYMLWDRKLDAGARFNWLNPSQRLGDDVGYSIEATSAYYPFSNQNLMIKLRYGYAKQKTPGEDALGPVTLLFPVGSNHLLTLQLMLAI